MSTALIICMNAKNVYVGSAAIASSVFCLMISSAAKSTLMSVVIPSWKPFWNAAMSVVVSVTRTTNPAGMNFFACSSPMMIRCVTRSMFFICS